MPFFKPATKHQSKARIAVAGPAGSGKTYSALRIALGLGGRIALADSERGSAAKYSHEFAFETGELPAFTPDGYISAIEAASKEGFNVLIIDSLSHCWERAKEMVDEAAPRFKGNSFQAWGLVTPQWKRMMDAISMAPLHVIVTLRTKTEYVVEQQNGKAVPRKIGTAPIIRDGAEYEFDVLLEMDIDHNSWVSKTRCSALDGYQAMKPGEQLGATIGAWLSDGKPRPAGSTVTDAPAPSPPAAFNWKDAMPEARTKYLLARVPSLTTLEGCAESTRKLKEADVGAEGYRQIMRAITDREKALQGAQQHVADDAVPDIRQLKELFLDVATTAQDLDIAAQTWEETTEPGPIRTRGEELIAARREAIA